MWLQTHKAVTEVLDLREAPAVNPQNPSSQGQQTLVLYGWARHLTLDLPAGSKPGIEEEVAIFSETDVEIFDTSAISRSEHQVVCVVYSVNVRKQAESFLQRRVVARRHTGSGWESIFQLDLAVSMQPRSRFARPYAGRVDPSQFLGNFA